MDGKEAGVITFWSLESQDALLLLQHSLAIPKMLYTLRTSPAFLSTALVDYDDAIRQIASTILNIDFSTYNSAWLQATQPINSGGLEFRSAVQLAPSAFLASAAGSKTLVTSILCTPVTTLVFEEEVHGRRTPGGRGGLAPPEIWKPSNQGGPPPWWCNISLWQSFN